MITENTLQVTGAKVLYPEAFPNHTNPADDVTSDAINLESSNLNLVNKPERIKKWNQITGKLPRWAGIKMIMILVRIYLSHE